MRADRELAADALALQFAGESESKPYGETLVKVLEHSSGRSSIPGMVGILEHNGQIKDRLRRIIRYKKSTRWSLLALIPVVLMGWVAMTGAVGQDEKTAADNHGAAPAESIRRNPEGRNGKPMRISAVDASNGSPVGSFTLHAFHVKRRNHRTIDWEERKTYERVQDRYEFELTEKSPISFSRPRLKVTRWRSRRPSRRTVPAITCFN